MTDTVPSSGASKEKREFFTPQDRENLSWFWSNYMKQRTPWLLVVMVLILLQGVAYQQFLALTERGLRVIFDQGQVDQLFRVCLMVFLLFSLRGAVSYIVPRLSTWLASGAVLEMRHDLIRHLMSLDLSYFDSTTPGETIRRLVNQAQALSAFVGQTSINAVRDLVTVVIVSGYLIYQAPLLFFSALIIAPLILLVLQYVSHRVKAAQREAEAAQGDYISTLEETVNGMRTVKILNQERFEEARLMKSTERIRKWAVKQQASQAIVMPSIDLASAVAYALVIGLGGYMAVSPNFDIDGAAIIAFLIGMVMVFDPMRRLTRFFTTVQARLVQLNQVHDLLLIEPKIRDLPGSTDEIDTSADIRIRDVGFGYTPEVPLFSGLNMEFAGGTRTAIVGATGSGKTTVLSLVSRLYEVEQGEILIGDRNIRDIRIDALRQSFSVVAQDIVIFNASIWENIRYVRPDASDEDVWAAAEAAEIADLIRDRGDAPLGPKGAQLSGGQKQRIAIARAFLRSAPILLLDEATSALDQRTEERIKGALDRLSQSKTTIIVAHRLSSIADADQIYVMDAGRVVEAGTHDELVAAGGLYAGMYMTQKQGYR